MPNEVQHIQWALHNLDVIVYLLAEPTYCDWTATVSFYTALHIVDAVLFAQETSPDRRHGFSHDQRRRTLKKSAKYQELYRYYHNLHKHSEVSRNLKLSHGKAMFFQQYMTWEEVKSVLLRQQLTPLMLEAAKLLGEQSANDLKDATASLAKSCN